MNDVFLIVGSNINPENNIPLALEHLCKHPALHQFTRSSVWKTPPVGSNDGDFLNLAICFKTEMSANDLKENVLLQIEDELGRVRQANKFAPRTIDLDIVVFNDAILDSHVFHHDYMIMPFAELLPSLCDPTSGLSLTDILKGKLTTSRAKKISFHFHCGLIDPVEQAPNSLK